MKEKDILDQAIHTFTPLLNGTGYWDNYKDKELDGNLNLKLPQGELEFKVLVKQEVREHIIRTIQELNRKYPDFLLVAYRIYPKYRELLKEMGINYLEANGNTFIQTKDHYIWIDKFPTLKSVEDDTNRAFTKTGLKVFFQLLVDDQNLNINQRELAEQAGVALGNIPLVLKGLRTAGLLVNKGKFGHDWVNKEEVIAQWVNAYKTTLKPILLKGKFRLPKDKDWKEIKLPTDQTNWGGEPGADLLTEYLRPEKFILFTDLNKNDFIKKTRLMPDLKGEIEVYDTFWEFENQQEGVVPPLLVYADLIINGDKRSLDTAQLIYDRYIKKL
jgi:hypothetical protein